MIWQHCSIPGHAAVDAEVEGVGEAERHVHQQDDLLHHLVVHELMQAENKRTRN